MSEVEDSSPKIESNEEEKKDDKKEEFINEEHKKFHNRLENTAGKRLTVDNEFDSEENRYQKVETNLKQLPAAPSRGKIVQLRFWSQEERAAPTDMLLSSLFGMIKRGRRVQYDKYTILASWKSSVIRYKGQQLDQADLDLFFDVIHLTKACEESDTHFKVRFTQRSMLRSIGRPIGGSGAAWLRQSIGRMNECVVNIKVSDKAHDVEYQGHLIAEFLHDKKTGNYVVTLPKNLASLFDAGYTKINFEKRKSLKGDLTKWLHNWISRYKGKQKPQRMEIEDIMKLSGSTAKRVVDFRRRSLEPSLRKLRDAGEIQWWKVVAKGKAVIFQPSE